MLIVALAVLTLLVVLGTTFVQLMRLEQQASENNIDTQRMDWVSSSALDRAITTLYEADNHYSWTYYQNTNWLYKFNKLGEAGSLAVGRVEVEDPRVGRWENYMEVSGFLYRFKSKVIDTNSQINLNGQQDTLARMLDHLGEAIAKSPRLKRDGRKIYNPFYTEPHRSGSRVRGYHILQFRQRLEGQKFQSKNQLRLLIGDENFHIVKDFLTCHSWEDPYTYRPDDGDNEVPDLALGRSGTQLAQGNSGGLGGGGVNAMPSAIDVRLSHEPRHPINVNTAPEEVLVACLTGLAGRRVFPYSRIGGAGGAIVPVDSNAQILGERLFASEEVRDVAPRPVFVYSQELRYAEAQKIAQRIVADRKSSRFLRTWRTSDSARPGFEDFIDGLDAGYFPSPSTVQVIDPDQPNNRQIRSHLVSGGASPIGILWQKGNAQGLERQLRERLGLSVHEQNAWYYDMMKGILKANFNPNTRISRYNSNVPAATVLDKSDLVWADRSQGAIPVLKKGHTTEFCFDSMGTFEITTLGEMIDLSKASPAARTAVSGKGAELPTDYFPFQHKVRTIVKVFDVLRHTNQLHFEQSFAVGARSSRADRKFVVTWPEPMNALTELYTQGSRRDGRVELAGLLDGRRQQVARMSRANLFGKDDLILAEHSFSERDTQNITLLRRVLQGKGLSFFGDDVSDALKGVFDFNSHPRNSQRQNREFYRRKRMQSFNVFRVGAAAWADPLIGKEQVGTDLFPDGLHTSMFRMNHLGNRLLVLPSHSRIGQAGGGGLARVGASGVQGQNILGPVPYYSGGMAFWVKFEFDGADPVFSGLIGCTSVINEVRPAMQDYRGSEGTQFFIFRNTKGELRIVRMYYHQAFPEATGEGGGSLQLFPDPGSETSAAGGNPDNPILEFLDQQKVISRADIVVDTRHFKAHEWHHIALDWNDSNPTFPIRVYLDYQPVQQGGVPRRPQQIVDGTANSWVRLNERQPKDGLQIGGIVRHQGAADAGVFKWYTNTARAGGSGGGVRIEVPSIKRIIANATIDELITYEGTFPQFRRHFGGTGGGAGYFTQRTGEFANLFSIPLPPDVNHVTLRSFDWTSYYPTMFTDSLPNSRPVQLVNTPIECDVWYRSFGKPPPSRFREPYRTPSVTNRIAGRKAFRKQGTAIRGLGVEFVYKFFIKGSKYVGQGNTSGGVVQTPAIDDVTLSYYLPNPKVLLQEEAN